MKTKLKTLIFSFLIAIASIGMFFGAEFDLNSTFAASPVSFLKNKRQSQTNEILVTNAVSNGTSTTYNLYSSLADLANFDYYTLYYKGLNADDNRLFHSVKNPAQGSDLKGNGQFVATLSFSKNMQVAANAGYILLDASANICSPDGGKIFFVSDSADDVTFDFYAYNDASSLSVSKSATVTSFNSTNKSLQLLANEISGQNFDKLALSFKSELQGVGVYNNLEVKNPLVIVSTTDNIKPSLSVSASNNWAKSRILTINATDNASGIYKVEVKQDNGEFVTILDNSTDLLYSNSNNLEYEIASNGTYTFKVTDNVGNSFETQYIENKIDNEKPVIEVSLNEIYTNKTFNFSANFLSNVASPENYYYTYSFGDFVSEKIAFSTETNSFTATQNGEYTFTFYAVDEAGNESDPVIKTIYVDDMLYKVDVKGQFANVTESFEAYRSKNNKITFAPETDNDYFYKLFVNGEEVSLSAEQIESCEYSFDITSNMTIEVLFRKQISLDIQDEYEYSPNGLKVVYTSSESGEFDIVFEYYDETKTNKFASVSSVGTYIVCYKIDNDKFFGSGEQKILIIPKKVEIKNIKTEYEYSSTIQNLIFEKSDNIELVITFYQNEVATDFLNAGIYTYVISTNNTNYQVYETGNVTMLPHKIEVNVISNSFVYDGEEKQVEYSLDVLASGVVVEYTNSLGEKVIPQNAGEYDAKFSLNDKNYVLEYETKLIITKRKITVSVNSKTITYGEDIPEITYSISNELESEKLSFELDLSNLNVNAGYYKITIIRQDDNVTLGNYSILYQDGYLQINKAKITIIPDEKQSKVYGEEDDVLTYSIVGKLFNDDKLIGELARDSGEDVGYYNITIGTLNNPNYELEVQNATYQIVKRVVVVQLNSYQKVYGELDPEFLINADKSSVLESDLLLFNNNITREQGENVGEYSITLKTENLQNYTILVTSAKFTILPKTIEVCANDVEVVFGESSNLSYTVSGLVGDDLLGGSLVREVGENVGEYKINLGSLSNSNYVINFTPAIYKINKRPIIITAQNLSKVYGEKDNLTFNITNELESDKLDISLVREQGEDVGTYQITGFVGNVDNYDVTFVSATLEITKKPISLVINNIQKNYGELDPEFDYEFLGLISNEEITDLNYKISRESGENVGEYLINLEYFESKNYSLEEVKTANLIVNKADINFVLSDKTETYSGKPVVFDDIDFEFDFTLKYTFAGLEIEAPVNAGEYKVQLFFEGNENYNAFSSNVANLVINKKMIPITLKQSVFVYNGNEQSPKFDINLDENVNVVITYAENVSPIEIGEYEFTISSNDPNYYSNFSGVLKIVSEFYTENSSGNASISSSNVSFSNSDISIYEDFGSPLLSSFSAFRDGRKCLSVFAFKVNNLNIEEGEVFTIRIKANNSGNDVKIFAVDKNGIMKSLAYTYENGEYVISLNDLSASILITEADTIMMFAKLILTLAVLILSYAIAKIVLRTKNNRFFNRNTKVHKFNAEEIEKQADIVASRVKFDESVSIDEYLSKQ